MAVEQGQIVAVRERIRLSSERRVAAETRLQANREEEARLLAEAQGKFGLGSLAEITAFVEREEAALEADLAAVNAALDAAAAAAAAVPDA